MPINFPDSPSLNEIYSDGGKSWVWDGTVWRQGAGSYASAYHVHSAEDITSGVISINRLPSITGSTSSSYLVRSDDPRLLDARSPISHNHSVSEITNLQTLLDAKAASSHSHTASDIVSGVLNIARLPVASSGSTSSNEIVRADDSRLSNSRTPTSHTHSISEITNLQTTLDGKGTVTSVSITTANGISGSVSNASSTPAITLTLGAITPSAIDISTVYKQSIVSLNTNATTIDCSLGNYFTTTVSSSITYSFTNVPASRAYSFTLEVNHSSGSITWPSSVSWPQNTAPSLTTSRTHIFVFVTDDGGTKWRGSSSINYVT